jgi:hypothetical protein
VSDIWVRPGRRDEGMASRLIEAFKEANKDADYFVSTRVKSQGKCRYIRVYDKVNGYKIKEESH